MGSFSEPKELILTSRGDGHKELGSALPWEYERALIQRIQAGDSSAEPVLLRGYDLLVKKHVYSMLNRHARASGLKEDMTIAGQLGVIRAANLFNLTKKHGKRPIKFFPYAEGFVRGRIWFVALEEFSALKIPPNLLSEAAAIRSELAAKGSEATDKEVAEMLNIPVGKVQVLWSASNNAMSLSSVRDEDSLQALGYTIERPELDPRIAHLVEGLTDYERDAIDSAICLSEPIEAMAFRYGKTPEEVKETAKSIITRLRCKAFGQGELSLGHVIPVLFQSKEISQEITAVSRRKAKTIASDQLTLPGVA